MHAKTENRAYLAEESMVDQAAQSSWGISGLTGAGALRRARILVVEIGMPAKCLQLRDDSVSVLSKHKPDRRWHILGKCVLQSASTLVALKMQFACIHP